MRINYQNGKIYAIRSYQTDDVYYGYTTQPLSGKYLSRFKLHYKQWLDRDCKGHNSSFEILKYNDCYIELFENYPCDAIWELKMRLSKIIHDNDNAVNKKSYSLIDILGRDSSPETPDNEN